jgi:hypothetical protein
MKDVCLSFLSEAFQLKKTNIVTFSTLDQVTRACGSVFTGDKLQGVLFDEKLPDVLFQFWRLVKAERLARGAAVIFPVAGNNPLFSDLKSYAGTRFGKFFLLTFDTETQPGVYPSQRGIFLRL